MNKLFVNKSKILAIIICICTCLLSFVCISKNYDLKVRASEILQIQSSEGKYYGVELPFESSCGAFYFDCGDMYKGKWQRNSFSGTGEYNYLGIGTFTGNFLNGVRDGIGNFEWLDGSFYTGTWDKDKISGDGKYISSLGYILKGEFSDNRFINGMVTYEKNDNKYEFLIKNGKYTKNVKIYYSDGTIYNGEYENLKITKGKIIYSNGDSYIGDFVDGKKEGSGKYIWVSGSYFIGQWSDDEMNGKGTYFYEKSSKGYSLEGNYVKNKPEGRNVYIERTGHKYITTWINGNCVKVGKE